MIPGRYLRDHLNSHNYWAVRLYLVQFLYLLNVFVNIFLIDVFLRKYKQESAFVCVRNRFTGFMTRFIL
jgi:hypothetical protein